MTSSEIGREDAALDHVFDVDLRCPDYLSPRCRSAMRRAWRIVRRRFAAISA